MIHKNEEGDSLGIRMESTADLDDSGQPQCIHHRVVHIHPDGLVHQHGVVCEGDEILEVSGRTLVGLQHSEAAEVIKDTPKCVEIVLCRAARDGEGRDRGVNLWGDVGGQEELHMVDSGSIGDLWGVGDQEKMGDSSSIGEWVGSGLQGVGGEG